MPPQQDYHLVDSPMENQPSPGFPVNAIDPEASAAAVTAATSEETSDRQRQGSSRHHSASYYRHANDYFRDEDTAHPPRIRSSILRRESFIVQFAKSKGPPQITLIMMLIAMGLGSTIGVVPSVMADRFAKLYHDYNNNTTPCSSLDVADRPPACFAGSADAQSAVATSNLISNVLTFVTSSLIGSLSDEHGRKGILILGLVMGLLSPLMLVLIQIFPNMSPWWYYGCHASTGLVNWIAVALSALADVLPHKFRAPGIGLLLAGFMLGFSLSPILAFVLSNLQLSLMSLVTVALGLVATIVLVPETLPPNVAAEIKTRREMEGMRYQAMDDDDDAAAAAAEAEVSTLRLAFRKYARRIGRFLIRPVQEMSILNRDTFFRLISLLAFFSGMVSSGDQVLLVYYLEERLNFSAKDVSVMFLIMGIMGLIAQGVLLKPFNDCLGEKWVVAVCFAVGAVDNVMYGLAKTKTIIYGAVALSALTGMAFPTISAIKANNVAVTEQGRIQGALYSLQALASGVGPVLLRFVYRLTKSSVIGPGAMFLFAAALYMVAVGVACALPPERANAPRSSMDMDDHDDDDGDEANEYDAGTRNNHAMTPTSTTEGINDFQPLNSDSEDSTDSYGSIAR